MTITNKIIEKHGLKLEEYENIKSLIKNKCKILGDGIPRPGAHGKPVIFIHPNNFNGTLIELEQI